jgi:hypothetical protein
VTLLATGQPSDINQLQTVLKDGLQRLLSYNFHVRLRRLSRTLLLKIETETTKVAS